MLTWQHWSERLHCVLHCLQGMVVKSMKIKSKVGCTQVHVLETSDMLCGKHGGYVHPFSETDFYVSIVFLAFGHIGKHVCYLFLQFPVTFFIFLPPAFSLHISVAYCGKFVWDELRGQRRNMYRLCSTASGHILTLFTYTAQQFSNTDDYL